MMIFRHLIRKSHQDHNDQDWFWTVAGWTADAQATSTANTLLCPGCHSQRTLPVVIFFDSSSGMLPDIELKFCIGTLQTFKIKMTF